MRFQPVATRSPEPCGQPMLCVTKVKCIGLTSWTGTSRSPDFLAHHSQHKRLADAVLEFYQKLMSNEMAMSAHAADFLKDWRGEEILDVDMKFAPFLKGKGVP